MSSNNHLLNQLTNPDKHVRLQACKQLRSEFKLSDEAVNALSLARQDPDPQVAHAALITLLANKEKIKKVSKIAQSSFKWLLIGLVFILLVGKTSNLECVREASTVNCIEEEYFLSLIPLRENEIRDVRSARVEVFTDYEGNDSYYVVLYWSLDQIIFNWA